MEFYLQSFTIAETPLPFVPVSGIKWIKTDHSLGYFISLYHAINTFNAQENIYNSILSQSLYLLKTRTHFNLHCNSENVFDFNDKFRANVLLRKAVARTASTFLIFNPFAPSLELIVDFGPLEFYPQSSSIANNRALSLFSLCLSLVLNGTDHPLGYRKIALSRDRNP